MKKQSLLVRYFLSAACVLKRPLFLFGAIAVLATGNAMKSRADSLGAPPQAQSVAEAAEFLSAADVIILGEVHDNAHHHQVQAELVTMLRPKALVWEMITQEQAERLTPQILQDSGETAGILEWEASGWPEFSLYAPVFSAGQALTHFGAQVPRSLTRAA